MRTRILPWSIVLAACATACGGTPSAADLGVGEQNATSAQDVEVAIMREAFRTAHVVGPEALASPSTGGMKGTWAGCVERSAKRDVATVTASAYAFAGDGQKIVNTAAGFGKIFIRDATEGSSVGGETLGYPAASTPGDNVTLDVVRLASSGDLQVERIMKPAADVSAAPALRTDYEASVYADPRAVAIAYVSCPASGHVTEAGGVAVVLYDDCQSAAFSGQFWSKSPASACTPLGTLRNDVGEDVSFSRDTPTSIELRLTPQADLVFNLLGATVTIHPNGGVLRDITIDYWSADPAVVLDAPRERMSTELPAAPENVLRFEVGLTIHSFNDGAPVPEISNDGRFDPLAASSLAFTGDFPTTHGIKIWHP